MTTNNEIIEYAINHYCTQAQSLKKSLCKREKIDFDLTVEWFKERLMKGCEITGIPFSWVDGRHNAYNPSIDRIDPNVGYVQNNCKLILRGVNMLKMNGTYEDVYKIATAICEHTKG